ncbi:putative nuclease HARBI1 [Heterodontus francisci]|uniref:putative nuclease HARBI1 n=1 Tax=Heterodontus francisci TaxID=7792 RepID=UPI00355B48FC
MTYLQMSERQCQRRLQMAREAVTHLCALLNDDLQPMGFCGHPMPVDLKGTAALNFYTSASFQECTSDLCGVMQSAVHHCIREVTNALYRRAIDYVCFRMDPESQAQRAIGFGFIAGLPQVQGLIDCTHVAIKAPAGRPAAYLNRKDFHSLNVQLVCDHHGGVASWRQGFPLQKWLLTLVRNLTSDAEERYNASHGATRATIEQAIGMLKMLFRCLDRSGGALQYQSERAACIIAVCCALCNYALSKGETL